MKVLCPVARQGDNIQQVFAKKHPNLSGSATRAADCFRAANPGCGMRPRSSVIGGGARFEDVNLSRTPGTVSVREVRIIDGQRLGFDVDLAVSLLGMKI